MQQHSELFTFAASFWWLIFPVGWGLAGIVRVWLRHQRARQALELLTSYAQQNREPPAEVLALLKPDKRDGNPAYPAHKYWAGGIFFAAFSLAFLVLFAARLSDDDHHSQIGLVFVAILMAGFSTAMLLLGWLTVRSKNTLPPP
jgi:hypothetical protein